MAEPVPDDKNRRLSRRRPPRGGVRVACHRGGLYLGPDLALSVLDLSETGARLILKEALEPGREVSIKLEGRPNVRPVRRLADVAWSIPMADGAHCVGVRFQKHLAYRDFTQLGRELSEGPGADSSTRRPSPGPDAAAAPRPVQVPVSPPPGAGSGAEPRAFPSPAERRRSERLPAERLLRCRVSSCEQGGPDFGATVLDVSNTGAGMLVPHRLASGAAVVVRFAAPGAQEVRGILARASYAAELAGGGFLLGVEFLLPLTEVECRAILSPTSGAAHGGEKDSLTRTVRIRMPT